MKERSPAHDEVTGEHPADEANMPGVIFVDNRPSPRGLREKGRAFLDQHPEILKGARKKKQDVVAFVSSHGTGILIGVGVAATAIGIGAVIFRRSRQQKERK